MYIKNKFLTFLITFLLLSGVSLTSYAAVVANIKITHPEHNLAEVEITFERAENNSLQFKLPTWRTGRYEILKLANGVRNFQVKDKFDNEIQWQKTDKSTWQVNDVNGKTLTVSYQLYANQLGKRTRHIDDSHAFLDASAVFMYTPTQRNSSYKINLSVPKLWRSVSGLKTGENSHQFLAQNYDVLVDSPIETGIHKSKKFKVDGRDYEVVVWGKGNYDFEKMTDDLKTLVKQPEKIWIDYPFSRYIFMVHATSGAGGATEHINSTIIQRPRYAFNSRKDYLGFLSTASHELVHTWNVKHYRPEGLVPYDYQQENYTSLLWLAEGSTSYLQSQLLMRGELMTSKEYLTELAKRITGYLHKPGRESQTVAQASFDNWISEGGDYAQNNSVNIYSEGFLVSWLLDFDILNATKLKKSYRDVHRLLYKNFSLPHAYSETDVKTVLKEVTGTDYNNWWNKNVHGHPKPNFEQLLLKAGLAMSYGKKKKNKSWSGIKTKQHNNGLEIIGIEKNSPAWITGLSLNDIIIAIDGLRIKDNNLKDRLANFKAGAKVEFTFFRRDQLMKKSLRLSEIPKETLKIKPIEKPSVQQKAFFKAWTGLDFPKK